MRHGQAVSNVKDITSCWPEKFNNPLTKIGRGQVKETIQKIKETKIDYIFASDILRTKQTSELVGKAIKVKPKFDKRLRELNAGIFNGIAFEKLKDFYGEKGYRRFKLKPKNGETYIDIQKRMVSFLKDTDKKYKGKSILIISHELPLILLDVLVKGIPNKDFYTKREKINTAEFRDLN
jgi:broad specificity phosphatase PhoE